MQNLRNDLLPSWLSLLKSLRGKGISSRCGEQHAIENISMAQWCGNACNDGCISGGIGPAAIERGTGVGGHGGLDELDLGDAEH
jgi:hypothetical protein